MVSLVMPAGWLTGGCGCVREVRASRLLFPEHNGFLFVLFRDEAEMDYLKIAQDLDMYGVSYFSITVRHSFFVFKLGGHDLVATGNSCFLRAMLKPLYLIPNHYQCWTAM